MNYWKTNRLMLGFLIGGAGFPVCLPSIAQTRNPATPSQIEAVPSGSGTSGGSVSTGDLKHDPARGSADAKALAKGNDIAAAEKRLMELNSSAVDTSAWHLETSQRLLHVASQLSREGSKPAAAALVVQSLVRLEEAGAAARRASDVRAEAQARALSAFIHHRYRGDTASAIASYTAALRLDPDDKAAREALGRLERANAILQARFKNAKGR